MANRRMINKKDAELPLYHELTIRQRYLYHMLMLYADDDGIMPVAFIQSRCFPLDQDVTKTDILDDIGALEGCGFIQRYANNEFIAICDWWAKQFIDKKLYEPTKHPTPHDYQIRPANLTKYSNRPYYANRKPDKT